MGRGTRSWSQTLLVMQGVTGHFTVVYQSDAEQLHSCVMLLGCTAMVCNCDAMKLSGVRSSLAK